MAGARADNVSFFVANAAPWSILELISPRITHRFGLKGRRSLLKNPGLYPVMVAAPWDGLLANWIRTSDDVAVQSVCREALELGFVPTQPSGFCADLWWLEVQAPCRFEPTTVLHHGVVALGLLERLTDAHATATSLLEVYPGGKLMGWPERAFIQWSYDDGEALTLELRAADAHGH